jgi:hypothetical protein
MKRDFIKPYNQLKKIGVPVYEHSDDNGNFSIDGEHPESYLWCDYYDGHTIPDWDFGINPKIGQILSKHGMFVEWVNPGRLAVYYI